MPTISLKDENGKELLSSDLAGAALGRYVKSAVSLRSLAHIRDTLSAPLADANGARDLALTLDGEVPVGGGALALTAGANASIGLHNAGTQLFAGSDLQAPVTVPNGTAYASLTLGALLKASASGQAGRIGFGFEAGTALRYAYFQPFDVVGQQERVGGAVQRLISGAVFPGDADDLAAIPVGAFVSLAGQGEVSFTGEATLSSATTLLATPGLPIVGSVAVNAGATATVGAEWTASGEFELRVSKPAASTLRLAFFRRRGRSLSVSATATAGVSATLKGKDLLATLMRAISRDPETDLLALVNAGLGDDTIEAMQQAIAASIDRSLTLAAQLQVSGLRDDQALFAYEIDVSRLDQTGKDAVRDALHGQLAAVGRVASTDGGPIRLVTSAARQLREGKTTWRINLLGILNVASFLDLAREGTMTFDPVSGSLTAADQVSAKRIRVKSTPLASDPEKLRKVLFESLLVTAAYQASRVLGPSVTLTADHTYVEQRGRTRRADLEDHYRALIALGLCDAAERDARLGSETEFGSSTFVIENRFDATACDTMFLDAAGEPHDMARYERIGRQALLALLPATDPARSFRRVALESDATWSEARNLGGDIDNVLPDHIRRDALRLNLVRGDVFTIVWWAGAMSRAAAELVTVRKTLGNKDATMLANDPAFRKAREKFADALERVVATSESRFDDPWDVLAMDAAAARLGTVEGMIVSTRFAAAYAETDAAPAAPVSRGARSLRAPAEAEAVPAAGVRPWTPEELDIFTRHVVNLRDGTLSGAGSFASSAEQVKRIFTEHIPAYAGRLGSGRRPRVLFFAHGGLVEEREGLLPVLARRRFWEMNGVYPVYFVWESGLKETLRDIVGGAAPARAERGALTDAAIEKLARNGGKQVWGQMKKSAEKASAPGGGARLVAELAATLWKDSGAAIEFHALGHSAGSILHAFFLPVLLGQKVTGGTAVSVQSLHFLAPAVTTDLFKSQLQALVGPGRPITRLTEYTMADELEQADSSLKPYGKSLLYLVSNAFEDAVPTPILGLQRSLKRDLALIRFFGLAGTEKVADLVTSATPDSVALNARTRSITHGGFDNDVSTMTSVIRRVLDVPDTDAVIDYFEDAIAGESRAAVGAVAPLAATEPRGARSVALGAPDIRSAPRKKRWTVMVWMAGDNDLESFGDKDLAEMKRVGSTDDVNVVVQFDSMRDDHTRRYRVTRGGDADRDIVQELGETNTGDPRVAIDFFRWAIERYPADRLLGVIWNHGAGIDDTDIYRGARSGAERGVGNGNGAIDPSTVRRALSSRHRRALFGTTVAQATNDRAIAFDDTSRDFLDNVELKKVLAEVKRQTGRTLDVLGFDACLMNMIEVAYQMRGTAQVVVGSEELEPGEGWPYDRILELIAARPTITGTELGPNIVRFYVDSYRSDTVTQSAFDLGRLDAAAAAVDALAKALTKAIKDPVEYTAVAKTHNATQRFDTVDFVDLGHFCQELSKRTKTAAVKTAAKATLDVLATRGGFVLAQGHKGTSVKNASGAAIYFPRGSVNKSYAKLDFAKATGWRTFLEAFHKA
jgi:hypothetical protein